MLKKLTLLLSLLLLILVTSCGGRGENVEAMELTVSISDENRVPLKNLNGDLCLRIWFEGETAEDGKEECEISRTDNKGQIRKDLTSRFAQRQRRRMQDPTRQVIGAELFFRISRVYFSDGNTREFHADIVDSNLMGNEGVVHGWAELDIAIPREIADDYYAQ